MFKLKHKEEDSKSLSVEVLSKEETNSEENDNSKSKNPAMALLADVEKLKLESGANSEIRKLNNERFAQISEQIGELRGMLNQGEKARQQLELKAEKASSLVESVQPDKLMINVQKVDLKIEALKAKVEASEFLNSKIKDDIRDMRNKFALFRNTEMIKEMNDDTKKRLNELKKVEAEVIKHSDKVDSIFTEVQKSFKDTKEAVRIVADMQNTMKKIISDNERIKSTMSAKASKDDVEKVKEDVHKVTQRVVDTVVKELEDYKRKVIREIEVHVKKEELTVVHQLIREELSKMSKDLIDYKEQYDSFRKVEIANARKIDQLVDTLSLLSMSQKKKMMNDE